MQWIKASERLPEMEHQVYIKDNVGCKRLGNFYYNDEDGYWLYICPNGAHEGFEVQQDKENFTHYEWLDESSPVYKKGVFWMADEAPRLQEAAETKERMSLAAINWTNLEQYIKSEGGRDFVVSIQPDNTIILHPLGRDGITLDFNCVYEAAPPKPNNE